MLEGKKVEMTIEELKKKIEGIKLPMGSYLTLRVYHNDTLEADKVDDQLVLLQKNAGDIDVVFHFKSQNDGIEDEGVVASIKEVAEGILGVDIDTSLYDVHALEMLIDVLNICREYIESFEVENQK